MSTAVVVTCGCGDAAATSVAGLNSANSMSTSGVIVTSELHLALSLSAYSETLVSTVPLVASHLSACGDVMTICVEGGASPGVPAVPIVP